MRFGKVVPTIQVGYCTLLQLKSFWCVPVFLGAGPLLSLQQVGRLRCSITGKD